ncbi:PD-(D/E)XK nuclease family protein [Aliarcobacter butzleri]|uniref:PDDEXK-like family protein n=1 Tax=Aliarcobacter butzleri TaxID=28197 RepID=UPI001EDB9875|nr:PD-(D/E)XK nuclease family protein [Aliarcobacter butzleri]MCG3655276.1 PD-(D/E)XK nuclease family protein [Aliarcobacter butzleri]MCG3717665.1 PD-(D/E)XK nuclease family protein [Aliarcobacter butzleri]MCT7549923.1 PD-(D/E)XK nuclease family protein [Aliarcobacter butzleri]MCT7559529.1 PD-(D/E)XK nuclease family protein [Aliarcobacter butzleri]MCT7614057.1 PD-(D/E)XK nuclease family protein [Aliarcobacter butzleri]
MLDERFINFFEKIKLFKEEQKKQKQRGLNDYNMVNVVRKENAEVGMHSNVIYSLIDPNGLHYQDELFLQIFIKDVLEINDFGNILSVQAEESTNENRRVDFTIKSNNYYIGIEMKVDASDLENQISHYYDDLKEKASKDSNQEVIIYYLTKNGKDASLNSHNNKLEYKRISFENHILTWIENCQKEVKNITNLNEAFENYKDIVKKITNKYEGRVMSLKNELLKNEEYFELAKQISEAFQEAKNEKLCKLKNKQINLIIEIVEEKGLKFENHFPNNTAIDILSEFLIRFIANDNGYLIQVFDKSGYGQDVDKLKKEVILEKLLNIDNRFKSAYSKVYGQITIDYKDTDKEKLNDLLMKLLNLKDEI